MFVITTDHGGTFTDYINRAAEIVASGAHVSIIGVCASACTLFLGLPPQQICVSPQAWLGFHKMIVGGHVDARFRYFAEAERDFAEAALWESYPEVVREKLGGLTVEMKWLRGYSLIPGIQKCEAMP
jgi:hypothetical protein